MASFFGHAAAALTLGRVSKGKSPTPSSWRFWILLVACSTIADLDVIGFWFGVSYQSPWGHRGFTHSFLFAALLAAACVLLAFRGMHFVSKAGLKLFAIFFLAAASHPLFDALTDGGLGVAFFWPFDNSRYFFPYRPIAVSPIGVGAFFSERGLVVMGSEALWIFGPCLVILLLHWAICARRRARRS